MSKFLRILMSALAGVSAAIVLVSGVATAGTGAGATPTFPQDPAIGGVRVGEVYSGSIVMRNFNTDPDDGSVNTVCNFGDATPPCTPSISSALQEDPGINLMLSCGELGNDSICTAAGADPGVLELEGPAVGAAGTSCGGTQFSVVTTDPTFGTLRLEPSDGSNVQIPGQLAECVIDFEYRVLRVPTLDSNPAVPGVQTIQITDNVQWSASAQTNASARGTTLGTTVLRAQPTISTVASTPILLGGGTLVDTATVAGRVSPVAGATVTFDLYGPDDATCAGTPIFTSTVDQPVVDGAVMSQPYTPTAPGTYRWIASYSGDANNDPIAGACNDPDESTVVDQAQPAIETDAGDDVMIGAELIDAAMVTGRALPVASTVDFRLYGPNDSDCSLDPAFESLGVPIAPGDTSVTSEGFTPTLAGTYRWVATYNGDANNQAATGVCGDPAETVEVLLATPRIATQTSPSLVAGRGQVYDTATVSGRVLPQAGATVDFRLYGPNDPTCSMTPVFESLGVDYPVAGGPVRSASYTPTVIGTYRWIATYSGDANNDSVSGECGEASETFEVEFDPRIELPATGSATGVLLRSAGALSVLGVALVLFGRRRRPLLAS